MARAFRQIPIDPHDYDLLNLHWKGAYIGDLKTAFGFKEGSQFCTRVSDLFRHVLFKKGYIVFIYIDDTVGCGKGDTVHQGFNILKELLEDLNFPISPKHLIPPTTIATCLGIIINTNCHIPEEKKQTFSDKVAPNDLLEVLAFIDKYFSH